MSDLKFYVGNLVSQSSFTLSNPNSLFPVSNILDPRRTKVVRTTTASDTLIMDFQETSEIDSIVIVDNPKDGFGISTLSLNLNGSNSWGSPSFTQAVTFSTEHGVGYAEFTQQNYRYGRLVFTSTLAYSELSKVFIGKSVDLGRCQNIGWSYSQKTLSKTIENRYAQKFVDVIGTQKEVNMSLSLLDKDQLDQIFQVYDECNTTKPFFMRCANNQMVNENRRYAGMFYLKSSPTITNQVFGRYNLSLSFEQAT
jgi:hypothetical protein